MHASTSDERVTLISIDNEKTRSLERLDAMAETTPCDLRVAITVDGITTLRDLHRAQAHVREKERREAARRAAGARERTSGK